MRVIKETEARERGRNPQSGTSSRIEIRQKTDLQTWTGVFKKGESVEIALRVLKSSVFGWLNGEGLDGVLENRDEIPVGDPEADMNGLRAIFGAEKVARSLRVWKMLIQKITTNLSSRKFLHIGVLSRHGVCLLIITPQGREKRGIDSRLNGVTYIKGRMKMCWTTCLGRVLFA